MRFRYKDKIGLRFINNLKTTTEHALAVEEMMMASDWPCIQFLSIRDKGTVMVGRQLKVENKVDLKKLEADGVTLRRQNTWGKVALLSNNNEIVISIVIPRADFPCKAKELLKLFNKVVILGNHRLGVDSQHCSENINAEYSKFNCFASITPGDIVSTDITKIAASTFGMTRNSFVGNIVVDLNGKSDVNQYLLLDEKQLPPTNISMAAERPITLREARDVYYVAFDDVLGLSYEPITNYESQIVDHLVKTKYTQDDWNLKQWRV